MRCELLDPRAVDHLRDQIRARAGLLDEALLAELHLPPFGPGADQGEAVGDEDPARPQVRLRGLVYGDRPVARTLCEVLHRSTSESASSEATHLLTAGTRPWKARIERRPKRIGWPSRTIEL